MLIVGATQFTNTPALALPSWMPAVPNMPLNGSTILAVLYSTLYILMEPVAGGLLAPLILGGTAYMNHLTSTYGSTANYWGIGLHIFSWVAQFVGHGKFEGRAPALLDNLVQALFLAPFFVWFEVLFFFGYRPELKSRVETAVQQARKRFKEEKAKKSAGENGSASGSHTS